MQQPSQSWLLIFALLMGFLSVALGAFAAHGLKKIMPPERLITFDLAARYQMTHALAICLAVWLSTLLPSSLPLCAGWLFAAGIIFFSGSLYLLTVTAYPLFGALTPLGGLFFLAGWLTLIVAVIKDGF